MPDALALAVDGLYAEFARYPPRPDTEGCPHCVPAPWRTALHGAPLRHLQPGALWPFASRALTTWGGVDDLRHFLPRMLELGAAPEHALELAGVVDKLCLARWREWPAPEQRAIERYFHALWDRALTRFPAEVRAADLLEQGLGVLFADLGPFLAVWESAPAPAALHQLAGVIGSVVTTPPRGRDPRLTGWLSRPATRTLVESAFFTTDDPDLLRRLSDAYDQLELIPGPAEDRPQAPPADRPAAPRSARSAP